MLGVTVKTIRHYHTLGLLPEPPRASNGYRLYDASVVVTCRTILRLQSAGLTLRQILALQAAPDPRAAVRAALRQQLAVVTAELRALQRRQDRLRTLLAEDDAYATAIAPDAPLPVPPPVRDAITALGLPDELEAFDLRVIGEVAALNWTAQEAGAWQAEIARLAQDAHVSAAATALTSLLAAADDLCDEELDSRADAVRDALRRVRPTSGAALADVASIIGALAPLVRPDDTLTNRQRRVLQRLGIA